MLVGPFASKEAAMTGRITTKFNNRSTAAIMACPLTRTAQGWEAQFATNHLGHFALTTALMPALLKGAPSRVVTLSSSGHKISGVEFDDIHFEHREYDKWKAYGQAKS